MIFARKTIKKGYFFIKMFFYSIENLRKALYNIDIKFDGGIMTEKTKKIFIDYIPMALTAALIIVFAFINKQSFIKTLPTLVTLAVQLMMTRANRFAFLVGGTNAILYSIAPWQEKLYFSVVSSLFISAPIQYFSFFNWRRKRRAANSRNTELKMLGTLKVICVIAATFAAWVPCYFLLRPFFSGPLAILDSLGFVWGIAVSLLSAFRYIDSQYLNIFGCTISIATWFIICLESPNNFNYLIISFYNLFMVTKAAINWTKQYRSDKKEKEISSNECKNIASASAKGE